MKRHWKVIPCIYIDTKSLICSLFPFALKGICQFPGGVPPKSVGREKLSAFVGSQVNTKAFFDEVDEDKSGSISKALASDSCPVGTSWKAKECPIFKAASLLGFRRFWLPNKKQPGRSLADSRLKIWVRDERWKEGVSLMIAVRLFERNPAI